VAARKSLSKKTRFEVFKRDGFTEPGAVSEDKGFNRANLISIRRFIEQIGLYETLEAAEIAYTKVRYSDRNRFKYFCGVCWKKIRDAADACA
jgi:hypothetical protein